MTARIAPDDLWLIWSVLLSGVALCIHLEQTRGWAAKLSGPVLALGLAMTLSNTGIMPVNAAAYDLVDDYLVPAAIPLLLLQADLGRILRESGPMWRTFHVATVGSMLGGLVAGLLLRGQVPLLPEATGTMVGSYIGGGVNFVALQHTYQLPAELANPLIVADNFIMAGMFAVLLVLAGSRWGRRWYSQPHTAAAGAADSRALAAEHWRPKEISLRDIALTLATAFVLTMLAKKGAAFVNGRVESRLVQALLGNTYLQITLFTVALTTLRPAWTRRLRGGEEFGMFFLYLFFFVIGLRADLPAVVRNAPVLFLLCLIIAVTNVGFTLAVGRLFRLNLEELLLACNATLGGAPSAAAMAIAKGWSRLVFPGLLVGIWGYVIGTVLGMAVAEALRRLGAGASP